MPANKKPLPVQPAQKHHYTSGAELTVNLAAWVAARKTAIKTGQPVPPLPDVVGEVALKMATRIVGKSGFSGYTFKEDMIADAMVAMCSYAHNFDVSKSTNSFSYLTSLIMNSIFRTLQKEQKETYIKALVSQKHTQERLPQNMIDKGHEIIAKFEARAAVKSAKTKAHNKANEARATAEREKDGLPPKKIRKSPALKVAV